MIQQCEVLGATCGHLTVHFSRTPEPACVDDMRFDARPSSAFEACMAKQLSAGRCTAGNFVDGDAYTTNLCP